MKMWKLALTLAFATLILSSAPATYATSFVPDGSYTFTATDGDTALNGSFVVFKNDSIVNWMMFDSLAASYSPYPPTDIPLDPSNSSISSFGVFGPNLWYFIIDGNNFTGANYYDQFKGENNLFASGVGELYDGFGDPIGIWTYRPVSTPDTGDTFQLLAGALIGLGACNYLVRRRAFARA